MSSEKKVFDVAKPGSSAPEIGSKPMVAGHKMMKDPSVTENDENKEPSNSIAQTSKIKIEPLSEEEKVENDTVVEGTEDNKQDNELNQTVNKEDIEDQKIEDDNPVVKPTTEEKSIEDKPELSSENEYRTK
jgi:hypothetical protein